MFSLLAFLVLMVFDLIPLYGVLVLGWNLGEILLTYSLEGVSVVIFVIFRVLVFCIRRSTIGPILLIPFVASGPVFVVFTYYLSYIKDLFPNSAYNDYYWWTPLLFLEPGFLPTLLPNFKWILTGIIISQILSLIVFIQAPLNFYPQPKTKESADFLILPFFQHMVMVQFPMIFLSHFVDSSNPTWKTLALIIFVKMLADIVVFVRNYEKGHFQKTVMM